MLRKLVASTLVAIYAFVSFSIITPVVASAANAAYCTGEAASFLSFPTWYKYLNPRFVNGECQLNASFPDAIPAILLAVFEIILRVVGLLAVMFVIYGGFQYLTTTGEPDKAKAARTTITNAIVGLMIAMLSTVIVNIVGRNIG